MAGARCPNATDYKRGQRPRDLQAFTDIEAMQTLVEMCIRPSGSDAEIGFDALAEVQPGGHFFAASHTMERYSKAFYAPLNADLRTYGAWQGDGAPVAGRLAQYIEKATKGGGAPILGECTAKKTDYFYKEYCIPSETW